MKYRLVISLLAFVVPINLSAQEPRVDVEKLADNVYLYTYNVHRSIFLVTDEGVLVTDPQSPAAAERYLAEVKKLSQAPIRYLVYSHHHADHISGGAAFGEDVVKIAHRNVPPHLSSDDAGAIAAPDVTFEDRVSVLLGDLEVRLIYPGPSETDSNIIVYIPQRKVAFMVDAVSVRALPWRNLSGGNPHQWIKALKKLAELDFEILAPGHGPTGTRAHVQEYIQYFTDLTRAVQERIDRGETLEHIQESLTLPKYSDWVRYQEHFKLNIEGVYRELAKQSS
ncbi:MAG: MBL fold metallo-hydrolase [Acidobacteriota bacterium]